MSTTVALTGEPILSKLDRLDNMGFVTEFLMFRNMWACWDFGNKEHIFWIGQTLLVQNIN
ncbi:hypothetical protein F8388_016772 [Cannabis sativa]|uniref:Uncharacterized protein n=1 Tax=Cannabis sativa TaxID=3483 RepID=A0A7J6ERB5_CANSA|nr:hypothetical protein F8388_016772 [Cannabis sativa]